MPGALALVLGLLVLSCRESPDRSTNSPHPDNASGQTMTAQSASISDIEKAKLEVVAAEGARVYGKLLSKFPNIGLYLTGGFPAGLEASLEFALPTNAWKELPASEQVALSYFLESQVAIVRRHPSIYALDPVGAPAWPEMERAFRSICATCWAISVGPYQRTGVSPSSIVLAGDEEWTRAHLQDGSRRATVFRRASTGREMEALTWDVPSLDPTARYHIAASSERLGHYEGDTFVYETPADHAGAWR
jgi:hypothetical protein